VNRMSTPTAIHCGREMLCLEDDLYEDEGNLGMRGGGGGGGGKEFGQEFRRHCIHKVWSSSKSYKAMGPKLQIAQDGAEKAFPGLVSDFAVCCFDVGEVGLGAASLSDRLLLAHAKGSSVRTWRGCVMMEWWSEEVCREAYCGNCCFSLRSRAVTASRSLSIGQGGSSLAVSVATSDASDDLRSTMVVLEHGARRKTMN
jgi:hypothetical protein